MAEDKHSEGHGEAGHKSHGGGHATGGHDEHEGAPEWLISFADNVVLMMGFFVILLAMNMKSPVTNHTGVGTPDKEGGVPESDQIDFVLAIREAFNPIDLDSDNPAEAALRRRKRERMEGGRSKQPEEHGAGRESQSTRPTDLSNLGGTVQFADDSSTLSESARKRVEEIAFRVRGQRFFVEVRGHASPSETYRDVDKGFSLSFARARAVAEALAEAGVAWPQIRMVACSDNERNVPRAYDESDRLNQRVEVVVTGDRLPDPAGTPIGGR